MAVGRLYGVIFSLLAKRLGHIVQGILSGDNVQGYYLGDIILGMLPLHQKDVRHILSNLNALGVGWNVID